MRQHIVHTHPASPILYPHLKKGGATRSRLWAFSREISVWHGMAFWR
jgi:hypothetical protein